MRIVILSRQPSLYSTRALAQAGRQRGHDVEVLDTLQFDIHLRRGASESCSTRAGPSARWTRSSSASGHRRRPMASPSSASSR
ncbi:MAG: hypothetical protein U0797_26380 [Gemmataceae bacterium]